VEKLPPRIEALASCQKGSVQRKTFALEAESNLSLEAKECCITCDNHLLAQDKTQSKQANFHLCHMKTIQKQMEKYISFQHGQHGPKKKVCTLYAFLMRFYFFQKIYLASKLIYFTRQK
jgi:hypothetical protein